MQSFLISLFDLMLNNVLLPNKLFFAFNSKRFEFEVHSKSTPNPLMQTNHTKLKLPIISL